MIECTPIVPQKYLGLTDGLSYYMALAHLIGKPEYADYTAFFKKQTVDGELVTLDNGVIENSQVTMVELVEKADLIGAQEIILPDVLRESKETIKAVDKAVKYLVREDLDEKFQIMVVPQGNSMEDWISCAMSLLNFYGVYISTIGVPKHLIKTCNDRDARLHVLQALANMYPLLDTKEIHLLGCWQTPIEIMQINTEVAQGNCPKVRSCDSANAYVYARKGMKFSDDDRPDGDPIDFLDGSIEDEHLLKYNIEQWIVAGKPKQDSNVFYI